MNVATQSASERVREADEALRAEHAELASLLQSLEKASNVQQVVDVLGQLVPKLKAHFEKEEHPGGLYDRMGATAQSVSGELQKLVDDHFRILSTIRTMRLSAEPSHQEDTLRGAKEILAWLKDHERREHELVRRLAQAT